MHSIQRAGQIIFPGSQLKQVVAIDLPPIFGPVNLCASFSFRIRKIAKIGAPKLALHPMALKQHFLQGTHNLPGQNGLLEELFD